MKHITQFQIANNDYVMVEVDEMEAESSVVPAGRPGEIVGKAKVHFEDALQGVLPAIKRVTSTLRELQPDEFEVEFGVKFNTQVGAMIAAIASEANLTVVVRWSKGLSESTRAS